MCVSTPSIYHSLGLYLHLIGSFSFKTLLPNVLITLLYEITRGSAVTIACKCADCALHRAPYEPDARAQVTNNGCSSIRVNGILLVSADVFLFLIIGIVTTSSSTKIQDIVSRVLSPCYLLISELWKKFFYVLSVSLPDGRIYGSDWLTLKYDPSRI